MTERKDPRDTAIKCPMPSPLPPLDRQPPFGSTPGFIEPDPLVGFQVRLREAWDYFRTERLKEAETAARSLITDLERGASRTSTPQPRPQAELIRLWAAAQSY